jgi:hypothetical protein
MAAVTGTVTHVWGMGTATNPERNTAGDEIKSCFCAITFAGTYASADNASTTLTGTALASFIRNGKTITVVRMETAGLGDLNGTKIGSKTVAMSSQTMTCELTTGDLSTEWADGAMSTTWAEGVPFFVLYTEA